MRRWCNQLRARWRKLEKLRCGNWVRRLRRCNRFCPWLGAAQEDRVGRNAQCVLDAEELAELIEQGQSEAGIAAQLDLYFRKSGLQSGTSRSNMGTMRA